MAEEKKKGISHGKKLGLVAFIFSEIVTMVALIVFFYCGITSKFDLSLLTALFTYQGAILTVTWGAKASSNFSSKNGKANEGNQCRVR